VRCALIALAVWPFVAPVARAADCAAWPGEFDPLPTVADADPLRARWARMRADQLAALAAAAEPRDRAEALRLWQRVQCLDPSSAAALAGIAGGRPDPVSEAAAPGNASERPDAPKPRTRRKPPERRAPAAPAPKEAERAVAAATQPPPPSVATELAQAEQMIRAARFDDALGAIERLRPDAARPTERARLELLAATAQVAFGDEAAARASLERALRADPGLALDESATSPKLLRVLDDARAVVSAPPYTPAASDVRPVDGGPP
jgi:hypothetical protein